MSTFRRFLSAGGDWFALTHVALSSLIVARAVPDASTEVGRLLVAAQAVLVWLLMRSGKGTIGGAESASAKRALISKEPSKE